MVQKTRRSQQLNGRAEIREKGLGWSGSNARQGVA